MNYVMSLDVSDVMEMIDNAIEKREEEKAWQMWLAKYPNMDKKTFIPFSQFYKKVTSTEPSKRPTEDILKEVAEIRARANPQIG